MTQVVALAGNPNCGKTTLFNQLTGLMQRVGNYPGVTVERKTGTWRTGDSVTVVDLPGAYSLVARSPEEGVAFDVLTGRGGTEPTLTVLVLDASNLERNLYLALQIMELGAPVVVALNMMDDAAQAGLTINAGALSELLGVAVCPIVASKGTGIKELEAAIAAALADPSKSIAHPRPIQGPEAAVLAPIEAKLPEASGRTQGRAAWLLASVADGGDPLRGHPELADAIAAAKPIIAEHPDLVERVIQSRYAVAEALCERVITRTHHPGESRSDRIDRVLLHPVLGPLAFLSVVAVMFESIFAWAEPLMDLIEDFFGWAGTLTRAVMPQGALQDLAVDGVITGVGSVLVFIPQIAILFFAIALLEDSGYLARAAYIMDRVMARVGLHGRAFVPLISGFACAVPAIMATRTIESERDRLVTILVLPLVSCSARLPVFALVITALFADTGLGGLLLLAMYVLSIVFTIGVAFVLKRTLIKSPTPPLVLELPPYRMPRLQDVLRRVYQRCKVFVRDAGTVILACSIVLWALLAYPKGAAVPPGATAEQAQAAQVHGSYAARLGRAIEPAIEPLGYDWRIGVGLIGSFAAREVLVATLGQVFGAGADADEENVSLRETLRAEYTPLVGLSLMIFFLLAAQCMSTIAIVRRETGTWRWPLFMLVYMTALAWIGAFVTYQGGRLLGFE